MYLNYKYIICCSVARVSQIEMQIYMARRRSVLYCVSP